MSEIKREQDYVAMLYGHVDKLREDTARRPADTEEMAAWQRREVARLTAVEESLCFGRLDLRTGERRYIGRLGLFDEPADEPLLLDWRAPAAGAFYTATAAAPDGVVRRRHIATRRRTVVAVDDEVLDAQGIGGTDGLTGEAALLAAVSRGRTGRMGDIVATLQAEQDRIIRAALPGVLVVQGGPGTGKTAVALHRAAYLLYTHQHLAGRGVLVVGPNSTFLDYIDRVLPGLGETSVLLATITDLYPAAPVERADAPEVAELKGRAAMATVLAAAIRDRRSTPTPVELTFEQETVHLDQHDWRQAIRRATGSRLPHNQARLVVEREIVDVLATRLAERMEAVVLTEDGEPIDGGDPEGGLGAADLAALGAAGFVLNADDLGPRDLLDDAARADLRTALLADPGVRAAVDQVWPALTPEQLLTDLFNDPDRLASAAPDLTDGERRLLLRTASTWTDADLPLLDEAAALLGVADRPATFGHVLVDEAQELSPMAWRLLMRRCPSRSMTIVGDLAQTSGPSGATSWADVLAPHVGDRWRLAELTVNYRTPAEIMAATTELLTGPPPKSVRRTGIHPWRLRTAPADLAAVLTEVVAQEVERLAEGRLAVLVPADQVPELGEAVRASCPATTYGDKLDLTSTVVLLTVAQAKGLEFDVVLIADPAAILAASPRGRSDLYVAMTRATQRLGVVHPGPPPAPLAGIAPAPA